ncbi:MAG TPA: agmatine deiminase family protein [Polyangia bacterium]|jgi:agmatine deiminase
MPAEWAPHEATWLGWPHNRHDWPGKFAPIPWVYAEIVRHLGRSEIVRILVDDAAAELRARRDLGKAHVTTDGLEFFHIPTNRGWTRDSGPMFALGRDGASHLLDWRFNAWAKYSDWELDDAVSARARGKLRLPFVRPQRDRRRIVLEGGSIDVDGAGLMLTTEECLLSDVQARNPGFTRSDYEAVFLEYLGIEKVLWLGEGIAGDDTHGHVDDIARFVGPGTVVAAVERDPRDPNHARLADNLRRLRRATDRAGRRLTVVPLPMPAPVIFAGRRLPASYANFYVANRCVLVPTFDDPNDRLALATLARLFPGRQVVGIHAVDLVWGLGTLHCLTQQQPAAP